MMRLALRSAARWMGLAVLLITVAPASGGIILTADVYDTPGMPGYKTYDVVASSPEGWVNSFDFSSAAIDGGGIYGPLLQGNHGDTPETFVPDRMYGDQSGPQSDSYWLLDLSTGFGLAASQSSSAMTQIFSLSTPGGLRDTFRNLPFVRLVTDDPSAVRLSGAFVVDKEWSDGTDLGSAYYEVDTLLSDITFGPAPTYDGLPDVPLEVLFDRGLNDDERDIDLLLRRRQWELDRVRDEEPAGGLEEYSRDLRVSSLMDTYYLLQDLRLEFNSIVDQQRALYGSTDGQLESLDEQKALLRQEIDRVIAESAEEQSWIVQEGPRLYEERLQAQAEEAARIAEQQRLLEEHWLLEQQHLEEQARLAEEQRILEQQRIAAEQTRIAAEQARLAEQQRILEQQRLEEQARLAEEQRTLEQQRIADEQARIAEEQARLDEQQRILEEQRRAEAERIAIEQLAAQDPVDPETPPTDPVVEESPNSDPELTIDPIILTIDPALLERLYVPEFWMVGDPIIDWTYLETIDINTNITSLPYNVAYDGDVFITHTINDLGDGHGDFGFVAENAVPEPTAALLAVFVAGMASLLRRSTNASGA